MSVVWFSGLNLGIGISLGILAVMLVNHIWEGYKFTPQQEATAFYVLAWGLALLGLNLVMSGALGTVALFSRITEELPLVTIVPFIAKLLAGVMLWVLIFWNLFWFYPTQNK